MRKIYLVRHGKPDFPGGEKCCIGTTDTPLSILGRMQGVLLGAELSGKALTCFSSPLSRAMGTAEQLCSSFQVIGGLMEMYAGQWDGLSFKEIRSRWPEIFEARGIGAGLPIPGSEDTEAGQKRFIYAVEKALSLSSGDIAVVAHATVNQSLICKAAGLPLSRMRELRTEYGSYSVLDYDGRFRISADNIGIIPHPCLTPEVCLRLLRAAGCPENIIARRMDVCGIAMEIADELESAGRPLNKALVSSSAMLCDIAGAAPEHHTMGSDWLCELGYPAQEKIVRQHHAPPITEINEASAVYIADKLVRGADGKIYLRSINMCPAEHNAPAASTLWAKEWCAASEIIAEINRICGKKLIC